MGLRRWFIEMLSRGTDTSDLDELVDFQKVSLSRGPLQVHALQESGIQAVSIECMSRNGPYSRVMVRRRDLAEALARHDDN